MESRTFVVIDDDPGDVEILRRNLEDIPGWKTELLAFNNSEECCKILPCCSLDVLFLDYMLGAETGLEVLKTIRSMGDQRPVVVLTGRGDEMIAAALTRAGADDYMIKENISPDSLRRSITSVMEHHKFRQEKALSAEQLQQRQKMEAIGAMAGGLAHDFNNMLTAMMGCLELAIINTGEREVEKDLLYMQKACTQMADLVKRLLSFSRRQSPEQAPVNLHHVLKEAESVLSHTIPKNIDIIIDYPDEPLPINGNLAMLQQVILNLCINSADAMPDGGSLVISAQKIDVDRCVELDRLEMSEGSYVILEVQDEGYGIDKGVIERVFEPFFTTKTHGAKKGTGLGLAVVRENIREHGGFVEVDSEPGQGTVFKVYFPMLENRDQPQKKKANPRGLPTGSEKIMVVEDEDLVRNLVAKMLQRLGYSVFTASDGVTALETYKKLQNQICGVLMDISMPRMGGRECLALLKEADPEVRVLFASGHDMSSECDDLMSMGASGIIQKPYKLADLAWGIRNMLDNKM